MNSTATTPPAVVQSGQLPADLHATLGAAFFGLSVGAILYGITLRQAYQYYTTNVCDSKLRKSIVALVCSLDTLHLVFAMYLVYNFILQLLGYSASKRNVLWSLKALGTVQVLLIVFVQGFYLFQIWRLSANLLLARRFALAVRLFVIVISLFSIAVAIIFSSQLQSIGNILSFTSGFEYVVYLGFGATAFVDCAIAAAMCVILHKSSAGVTSRSETVLDSLIQYFVGSGLLTSFSAILVIILYVIRPNSLLYLGMELSVTRFYANSVLAMFNSRQHLREKFTDTMELKIPTNVFFSDPDAMSATVSLIGSNPFSPGQETKYSECNCHSIRGRKDSRSPNLRSYTV